MPISRRKLSTVRYRFAFAASASTLGTIAAVTASLAYTGAMPHNAVYHFFLFATGFLWLSHLVALIGEEIMDQLQQNARKLDDIETEVTEYGDVREAQGQQLAIRILRPGDTNGGRLRPVD